MTAGVHKVCKLYAQDKKILHQNLLYQIETVQLLRYKPGGFYIPHVDQGPYANRALSYIYFVNDEFEGGGLNFFLGNDKEEPYHINPKKNSAVVFPSNFVFTHEVCPISSGERYTLVTWIL